MEFDWATFALEVLNFLVLVWLLKRFFYRPVLAVIEARRAETTKTIADAETVRHEAEQLQGEYQAHLAEVDTERTAAKARLDADIAAERSRRLAAVGAEIVEERKRREAMEAREKTEVELALERQATMIAARFAARFLERLACPELEAKLADLALSELAAEGSDKLEALHTALKDPDVGIKVVSAYALDETRRAAFTDALGKLAGRAVVPKFAEDTALKAGVCIMAGSWVLMANLRDELNFFATAFEHGS